MTAVPEERRAPNEPLEPWFGCFTGDCPHDTQAECDVAIRAEFARLERVEAAAVSRPRPEAEERRAGEPRGPERYLMHVSQVPDDATIAEQILAAVSSSTKRPRSAKPSTPPARCAPATPNRRTNVAKCACPQGVTRKTCVEIRYDCNEDGEECECLCHDEYEEERDDWYADQLLAARSGDQETTHGE